MEPADFEESNTSMGPPKGKTEDEVYTIRAWRGFTDKRDPLTIVCFKPTSDEIDEIRRTGRVWVSMMTHTMPPIGLIAEHPFETKPVEQETG